MQPNDQHADTHDDQANLERMPRWVRAVIVTGVLALVFVVVSNLIGPGHGPGRHQPETPSETPATHVPPVDHT